MAPKNADGPRSKAAPITGSTLSGQFAQSSHPDQNSESHSSITAPPADEGIRRKAESLQHLVEKCLNEEISDEQLKIHVQDLDTSSAEVQDLLDEVHQWREISNGKGRAGRVAQSGRNGPSSDDEDQGCNDDDNGIHPDKELEEELRANVLPSESDDFTWRLLAAKLRAAKNLSSADDELSRIWNILDPSASQGPARIPDTILAVAPHLDELNKLHLDLHIQKTIDIRQAFVSEKYVNLVVQRLLLTQLRQPLPVSIWKDIVLDKYVNFEKLHATLDPSYDYNDDVKDFGGGYGLVKKEQYTARKKIVTEAEWTRVYRAWAARVTKVYPHRASELEAYESLISDIFHSAPAEPTLAIGTDLVMHCNYAQHPYRLDSREQAHVPVLTQVLAVLQASSSATTSSTQTSPYKRKLDTSFASSLAKCPPVPCENWNLGLCTDPCVNGRKHSICCECFEPHRAQEHPDCLSSLRRKRGARALYRKQTGRSGT